MNAQKPKSNRSTNSSQHEAERKNTDSIHVEGVGNVVTIIEKGDEPEPPKKGADQGKSVVIIVALIGLLGTLGAALISTLGDQLFASPSPTASFTTTAEPTETFVPTPLYTETLLPDTPTVKLVPLTDTPEATSTFLPVAIGEDWKAGCISTLWSAHPFMETVDRGDGCWREPVYSFSAENGDLDFLAERGSGSAEVYGLFMPLPESGTVTFTIRLKELHNADLWMGVFPEQDVKSAGLLMAILNGDVNRRSFVQKDPATYETMQGTVALHQGNGYSISFIFNNLSARSRVNPNVFVTNQISIPSAQKWLFLGYTGLRGTYRIEGTFLNFEIKP